MGMVFCRGCGTAIHETALSCPQCGAAQMIKSGADVPLPDGIKGWSWGAFLLSWLWAIFNRTWWGLLAFIPYVGLIVALWLGFKGREMAWRNCSWDSVEHFNRVQKKWSQWGVILVFGSMLIGIIAAIAIPAYQTYALKQAEQSLIQQ